MFYEVMMLLEKNGEEAKPVDDKDETTSQEENTDETEDTATDDTDFNMDDDMSMDDTDTDTDSDPGTEEDTNTDEPTDETSTDTETEVTTEDDTATEEEPKPNNTTKKINLINGFESLYNALSDQISAFSMISVNSEEENDYIQDVISKLENIKKCLFDYITIELKNNTYEKNLYTFYSFKDIIKINIKIVEKIIDLRKNN